MHSEKVNVLLVIPTVEVYRAPVYEKLGSFQDINLTVMVYTLPSTLAGKYSPQTYNLEVSNTGIKFGRFLWHLGVYLPDYFKKNDVIIVCGEIGILSNYPLIAQARNRGVKVIWWSIGRMPGQRKWTLAIRTNLMKLADSILLYADPEIELYRSLGFDPARLFATNNSIDQKPIIEAQKHWTEERLATFRKANSLTNKEVFLYCGRLNKKPKLELALKALCELKRRGTNSHFVCIGSGDQLQSLRDLAKRLSVIESVTWLQGLYDQEALAPWFMSANSYVYPGSVALGMHHAFGYGLPVITTDNKHMHVAEMFAFENEKNGLFYRDEDVNSLADTISLLDRDIELRQTLSRNARITVGTKFTIDNMVNRIYKAIIDTSMLGDP